MKQLVYALALLSCTGALSQTTIQLSGESIFKNGKATIELDALKHIPEYDYNYQIIVVPEGDTPAMFISNKSNINFTVTQLGEGEDGSKFSWILTFTIKPTTGGPTITKVTPENI
jgi:hypothetical protein